MSILPLYLRSSEAPLDTPEAAPLRRLWQARRLSLPITIAYVLLAGVLGLSALLAHVQSF